ncbi:phosphoglucosamine mutase [Thermoproteota archaeon]
MKSLMMAVTGIRGIIGETLTPDLALKAGKAFGTLIGKGPVILGGDTRISYLMVKQALVSGLMSVGTDIMDIGQVPTPTVQQMIRYHRAQGGVVITASHNPIMWNGIKLMNHEGSFINEQDFDAFLNFFRADELPLSSWDELGQVHCDSQSIYYHVDRILEVIDPVSIRFSGLKVLVDANNGTGALANPILLDRLGVEYEILNPEPNGRFAHDPEPLEKNLSQIKKQMAKGGYDIGFVQDADADRLVILDENGRFIGEDYSFGFCVDYLLSQETARKKTLVVNLSTSKLLEWIAEKYGAQILYSKIGEAHVTQMLKQSKAQVGGEGNGGIIFPKIGWGRDSLVGITVALKYLADSKKKVSEIVAAYPRYVMVRDKVSISNKEEIGACLNKVEKAYRGYSINMLDGLKISLDDGWIHVRPSNTEPIIRIFIEAKDDKQAEIILNEVKNIIK